MFMRMYENCKGKIQRADGGNGTTFQPGNIEFLEAWEHRYKDQKALKQLATCEHDWNTDCKDVTEKNFNEFTIQGQLHVIDKVCHDDGFSVHYDMLLDKCIMAVSKDWTACFVNMKFHTDLRKAATNNWAHYETHFYLCCERTRFRRCTLEVLLKFLHKCTSQQSILLQKFSTIISEGEVFQDCNFNMMYPKCPGGDPRPPTALVSKLMKDEYIHELKASSFRPTTMGLNTFGDEVVSGEITTKLST
ncbi:uncharacterized protein LOC134655445 [Cydia amplana]|uniref:uncharacterized protein LOC134655445 n=1 Tax=Cydia amplana TaxID=1869771 RepID=UPI002FE528F5